MIFKTVGTFFAFLIFMTAFVMIEPAEARSSYKKVCKSVSIRSAGSLRLDRYLGKVSARIFWRGKVKRAYGWRYASWSLAKNKKTKCRLRHKARYYRCVVSARPCTLIKRRRRR